MTFLHILDIEQDTHIRWAQTLTRLMGKDYRRVNADDLTATRDADGFSQWLQDEGVDLIFISCYNDRRILQRFLNACRSLRIPYVVLTDTMRKMPILAESAEALHRILAPVTMLEEEVHKAEILGHLIRYTGAGVTLLQAKDYGHKAAHNVGRILTFLEHQGQTAEVVMGIRDSMSLYKELADRQREQAPDMVVVTASREYGLDDLFFGPAERHVLQKAQVPVMLLNPRGDLFSLCD